MSPAMVCGYSEEAEAHTAKLVKRKNMSEEKILAPISTLTPLLFILFPIAAAIRSEPYTAHIDE